MIPQNFDYLAGLEQHDQSCYGENNATWILCRVDMPWTDRRFGIAASIHLTLRFRLRQRELAQGILKPP